MSRFGPYNARSRTHYSGRSYVISRSTSLRHERSYGWCRREEHQAELGPGITLGDITKPETYDAAMATCNKLVM